MSTLEKTMTTQEVANRLVELCRTGKMLDAQEELFADDIMSVEPFGENPTVSGKSAVIEKGKQFASMIQEVHNSHISEPVIAGNCFSIAWLFEVTMKGKDREKWEEICVYNVKDGKITTERFFM